eukprot:6235534-Prymnesium_polylepis.1
MAVDAMQEAIVKNDTALVRKLLVNGSKVDSLLTIKKGKVTLKLTPLTLASLVGSKEVVKVLIEAKADLERGVISTSGEPCQSPLMAAVQGLADVSSRSCISL